MDITFLPSSINQDIGSKAPSTYLNKYKTRDDFKDIMESHMIPVGDGAAIWKDKYEEFLNERAKMFMAEIKGLAGEFSGFEDEGATPIERVENTEALVRETIHNQLSEEYGAEYWDMVPGKVVEAIKDQVGNEVFEDLDARAKTKHISMREAAKIIEVHWGCFNTLFPSSEDSSLRLRNLDEYKSELSSEGDVDEYTKLDGDLAIQWCNSCLRRKAE